MNQKIDVLSFGDVVTDAFIKLKPQEAEIEQDGKNHHPLLCMTYGTKIPFEETIVVHGVGNSPNAAVCFAKMGLNSSLYANIGDDKVGEDILLSLKQNKVSTEFVHINRGMVSNYHYVLWYKDDRTILIKHEKYPYKWPEIREHQRPHWIYLSSIAENGIKLHDNLTDYLENNQDVKLAFQPGTFQIREGVKKLRKLYSLTEFFCVNKEEAQIITQNDTNNIVELIKIIHSYGPKIVAITDGPKGSYASDGKTVWSIQTYPDPKPPYDRTGAGDAYTATFVAALVMGEDLLTAMKWAPINPMSVVQQVGAQAGLLTKDKLLNLLRRAPRSYEPKKVAKL